MAVVALTGRTGKRSPSQGRPTRKIGLNTRRGMATRIGARIGVPTSGAVEVMRMAAVKEKTPILQSGMGDRSLKGCTCVKLRFGRRARRPLPIVKAASY